MTEATKTLAQLKKASKLTRLAFHKNGPKSYKRGQGALLNALLANDGTTQRELVKTMGMDRSDLKGIVKKAERNGYVTIEDCDAKHTYAVKLTDEGRKVAEKRVAANDKTAESILDCLSADEVAQLNALTEKLILSCKDKGKEGVVLRALPQKERVVVEKVNMIKKAMRPTQQNPQGGISTMEAPIHVSNVMVICPECKQPTRTGKKRDENGKKIRVCKKCGKDID